MSCRVVSCRVLSCRVVSCRIVSCFVLSSNVLSLEAAHGSLHSNYIFHLACSNATSLGAAFDGRIPNGSFYATSYYKDKIGGAFTAVNGRLNNPERGWCASHSDDMTNQYLQIDLGAPYFICAVATQGNSKAGVREWTTFYNLKVSMDSIKWTEYQV